MRLMEAIRLRVGDLDFGNGRVIVRNGKGGKDRVVPLPQRLGNAELFSVSRRAGCPAIFQLPKQLKNGAKRKSHFRFAS
jgi:integrase